METKFKTLDAVIDAFINPNDENETVKVNELDYYRLDYVRAFAHDVVDQIVDDSDDLNDSIDCLGEVAQYGCLNGSARGLIYYTDVAQFMGRNQHRINDVLLFIADAYGYTSPTEWFIDCVIHSRNYAPCDPLCVDVNQCVLTYALVDAIACGLYQLATTTDDNE